MNNIISITDYERMRKNMEIKKENIESNEIKTGDTSVDARWLLDALFLPDSTEEHKNANDDTDLGEVLERFYGNAQEKMHRIRYSDGIERVLTFDE